MLVRSDGTKSLSLKVAGESPASPDWSPKGDAIAYDAVIDGFRQIFIAALAPIAPPTPIAPPNPPIPVTPKPPSVTPAVQPQPIAPLKASFSVSLPEEFLAGQKITVSVTVRNEGQVIWEPTGLMLHLCNFGG